MPEKSYREMSEWERRRNSLAARTGRSALFACIILGAAALLIGLFIYGLSLSKQYTSKAFSLAQQASMSVSHGADSRGLAEQVMARYRSLSAEQRAKTGTPEYRALFAEEENSEAYDVLIHMLAQLLDYNDVFDIYLAMYDRETCAMVYIVDPDESERLYPGEWEAVTEKGMNKFLDWDGNGELYDIDRTDNYGWLCTAGMPIRDKQTNEILLFVLVDISIDNIADGAKAYVLQITAALLVLTALIAWYFSRRIKRNLAQPINAIADAAQAYSRDKQQGITRTDHFSSLNIRSGDEIENLSLIMADMERDLAENEENLSKIRAEKERISTELSLATRIQTAMLPGIFPPYPNRKEFDIYAMMHPAREVGGDFYDFFLIDDDHLCLVMADVSGKGIPAALFMMISMTILKSCAMLGRSPAEIMNKANEAICSNNPEGMFFTAWLGILEISTGRLTTANAGHEYPAFRRPDGSFELIRKKHGCVIGGFEDEAYKQFEFMLEPGTTIFVYTDGVPEAMQKDRTMFGTGRMLEALNEDPSADPEQLLKNVRCAVEDFVDGADQSDDITMLALRYFGPEKRAEGRQGSGTDDGREE